MSCQNGSNTCVSCQKGSIRVVVRCLECTTIIWNAMTDSGLKSDGKIENDLASIFFGIYYIVSVYKISIPMIYNII